MMSLEEIKTAVAALPLEERLKVTRFLATNLKESDLKTPPTARTPDEEMDAWADAVNGPERFKDGR